MDFFITFYIIIFLILMTLYIMYLICQYLRCNQELQNQNNAVSGQSIELNSTIQIGPVSSLGQSALQIIQQQRNLTDFERGDRLSPPETHASTKYWNHYVYSDKCI